MKACDSDINWLEDASTFVILAIDPGLSGALGVLLSDQERRARLRHAEGRKRDRRRRVGAHHPEAQANRCRHRKSRPNA